MIKKMKKGITDFMFKEKKSDDSVMRYNGSTEINQAQKMSFTGNEQSEQPIIEMLHRIEQTSQFIKNQLYTNYQASQKTHCDAQKEKTLIDRNINDIRNEINYIGDSIKELKEANQKLHVDNDDNIINNKLNNLNDSVNMIKNDMYKELEEYKNDMYFSILKPALLDLIYIKEKIGRLSKHLCQIEDINKKATEYFSDIQVEIKDILYKYDIEEYSCESSIFDPKLQQIVEAKLSNKPERTIIEKISYGYKHKGKIIQKEKVNVSRNGGINE